MTFKKIVTQRGQQCVFIEQAEERDCVSVLLFYAPLITLSLSLGSILSVNKFVQSFLQGKEKERYRILVDLARKYMK